MTQPAFLNRKIDHGFKVDGQCCDDKLRSPSERKSLVGRFGFQVVLKVYKVLSRFSYVVKIGWFHWIQLDKQNPS